VDLWSLAANKILKEQKMNTEFYFPTATVPQARHGLHHKIVVRDYEAALLYRHGKFVRQLPAGRHIVWGFGYHGDGKPFDHGSVAHW